MSRFVSGGTDKEPLTRDDAWLAAQRQPKPGVQADGKSLYETLQANKAAKQEAFEESTRLRNQFRSLDEDEVEFLDSVLEGQRAKEAEVRRETRRELEAFRREQEEAEKRAVGENEGVETEVGESWTRGARKRRRRRGDDVVGGLKIRRTSTAEGSKAPATIVAVEDPKDSSSTKADNKETNEAKVVNTSDSLPRKVSTSPSPPAAGLGLGLAAYSSDDDDDDG